jgi:hypothetical protein
LKIGLVETRATDYAKSVLDLDLITEADSAYGKLLDYYNYFRTKTVRSPNDATPISPNSIKNLTTEISPLVGAEFNSIKHAANNIQTASTWIYQISNAYANDHTWLSFDSGVTAAAKDFEISLSQYKDWMLGPNDWTT